MLDLLLMLMFIVVMIAGVFNGYTFIVAGDLAGALTWFGIAGVAAALLAVTLYRPWRKGAAKKGGHGFLDYFSAFVVLLCCYYTYWYTFQSADYLLAGIFALIAALTLVIAKPWKGD